MAGFNRVVIQGDKNPSRSTVGEWWLLYIRLVRKD
jgi:hypothetical protein